MKALCFAVVVLFLFACGGESGPELAVSAVTVTHARPGTSMSAGYFTFENRGGSAIVVTNVDSPQYARVDMHETVVENDVARMRSIDELRIAPGASVVFEPGGKHLMLREPDGAPDSVTLNFFSGDTLLLSVTTVPTDP